MNYLATLGGVTLIASDYSADPLLPASEDVKRANWQFSPGTTIWSAMSTIREYSGWLLYPDNQGRLIYKPFPTADSSADWTINMGDCLDVQYGITDLAKTRFQILGQAGKDDPDGKYKKGDGLLSYKTYDSLETLLGESRPLWLYDPALGTPEVAENMLKQLADWYTGLHIFISFQIPDFKAYKEMGLYQVLSASDSLVTDINGKYIITDVDLIADPFQLSGTVRGISL